MSSPTARGRSAFHCLPKTEAGSRMPTHSSIMSGDRKRLEDAKRGSEALLKAILAYYAKHHSGELR